MTPAVPSGPRPLNLRRNSVWAVAEIVISAAVMFALYHLVVSKLGLRLLGVWSLVLATTSLVRLGDLGAATGLGRFVAIANSRGQSQQALVYIETAIVSNALLYGVISVLLYFPLLVVFRHVLPTASIDPARALLPYALISFALLNVNGALTGALLGLQRADLKSAITVASLVLQFGIAVWLTPTHGLVGLALAQTAQYIFAVALAWVAILRQLRQRFYPPTHWDRKTFRELLGFGMQLQAASIISFLYDPLTKFVLSSLGGLEALGVYELSSKLVQQVRQIVVGPSQILMPAFAQFHDQGGDQLALLYQKSVAMTVLIGVPLMIGVVAGSPAICWIWMGHVDPRFLIFTAMMSAGWLCNQITAPAYLLGIGTGRVGWNIWGHLLTSVGSPLLGLMLGPIFGATGIVGGSAAMLALGSLLSMVMNCRREGLAPLPRSTQIWTAVRQLVKWPARI